MIRLIALAIVVSVACRWIFGKWPWEYLGSSSPRQQSLTRARQVLGVRAGASAADIREAHRRLAGTAHPDRGGTNDQIQELNAARDLLLGQLPPEPPESRQ